MNIFEKIRYILCGKHCEPTTHAIRQRRALIDGSGIYYIYIIDICED